MRGDPIPRSVARGWKSEVPLGRGDALLPLRRSTGPRRGPALTPDPWPSLALPLLSPALLRRRRRTSPPPSPPSAGASPIGTGPGLGPPRACRAPWVRRARSGPRGEGGSPRGRHRPFSGSPGPGRSGDSGSATPGSGRTSGAPRGSPAAAFKPRPPAARPPTSAGPGRAPPPSCFPSPGAPRPPSDPTPAPVAPSTSSAYYSECSLRGRGRGRGLVPFENRSLPPPISGPGPKRFRLRRPGQKTPETRRTTD